MKPLSSRWGTALFGIAVVAMGVVGLVPRLPGGLAWVLEALLMTVVVALIGLVVTGQPAGVLVNGQNLISLSRFQMALWTVLLLSAWVTIVLRRMGAADPLAVAIDPRLWALMGISTTSLVGTPLLLAVKMRKTPAEGAAAEAARVFGQTVAEVEQDAVGLLYVNPTRKDALFTDMFGGDELGDTHTVDLAKVQMFFATIAAVAGYSVSLFRLLQGTAPGSITSLPTMATWLVALVGVSHGGYLVSKTARQTPVSGSAKGGLSQAGPPA